MFKVDALGKACPLPVIETRKALKEHDTVATLVDNKIATQNLEKMAKQLGYVYQMQEDSPTHYTVVITKGAVEPEQTVETEQTVNAGHKADDEYIVVINSDKMGIGEEKLGKNLMKTFIYTLTEQDVLPQRIIFYNGGVPLVTEGSESLEDLKNLAAKGVEIYACGACLNFYGLTAKVAVGEITNMYRIVEMMRSAYRIVKP
ncbi:MAG: sulfurtransferase-like selenium metabolism protein YedF [Clostridiaceae bacterium]